MNTKFIKDMLYEMKKDYGARIRYITLLGSEVQVETGKREFIKKAYDITAVVLPRQLSRKFIQDIGYLAANKNFTYGALNDYSDIKFIIDQDDLPKDVDISLDGYVVYNHTRYEKTKFELIEHQVAFLLSAKAAEGGKPYDIMPAKVGNSFQIQQGVSYELN